MVGQTKRSVRDAANVKEEEPLFSQKLGVLEAPELGHASRRFSEPCRRGWLFVGSPRQVECMCLVSGAAYHDEELGPMLGMSSTLDAELQEQRTIERAELIKMLVGPTTAHGNIARSGLRHKQITVA